MLKPHSSAPLMQSVACTVQTYVVLRTEAAVSPGNGKGRSHLRHHRHTVGLILHHFVPLHTILFMLFRILSLSANVSCLPSVLIRGMVHSLRIWTLHSLEIVSWDSIPCWMNIKESGHQTHKPQTTTVNLPGPMSHTHVMTPWVRVLLPLCSYYPYVTRKI